MDARNTVRTIAELAEEAAKKHAPSSSNLASIRVWAAIGVQAASLAASSVEDIVPIGYINGSEFSTEDNGGIAVCVCQNTLPQVNFNSDKIIKKMLSSEGIDARQSKTDLTPDEITQAFVDVLDGNNSPENIEYLTGLSQKRCNEISEIFNKAVKVLNERS